MDKKLESEIKNAAWEKHEKHGFIKKVRGKYYDWNKWSMQWIEVI